MNIISSVTSKLLEMSMLVGVGPATLRDASRTNDFENKGIDQIALNLPRLKSALSEESWEEASTRANEQINLAMKMGCRILSPLDDEYPKLLAATKDDPFLIWVKGVLSPTPEKSVAIIGTREPTEHGKIITQRIARYFVEQGWSIVSGLAVGCDAIAHREAMISGGHTVAVMAHGLQTIAPSNHRSLAEDILKSGGALLSQYPLGREAIPQQFAQRDKTQAGLAKGVVMIQSDLKGGSLHASRAAIDFGRWLAVPYPTEVDRSNNELKIQANLVLAKDDDTDKKKLLQLKDNRHLGRLIVLKSKDDYLQCVQFSDLESIENGLRGQ